jgi:endonuclease/exonuclease/phosphatase family metal-dependent hydrolase
MKWIKIALWIIIGLVALFCLFLLQATLMDYKPDPAEKVEKSGIDPVIAISDTVFSITTWNLGYFGLGKDCDFFFDGGKMTRPSREQYVGYSSNALKYLQEKEKTDFYFFQEVDFYSKRSYYDDQLARLRNVFTGMESMMAVNYKVSFVPVPVSNPLGRVNSGLVSFSAFNTVENTRYAFPTGYAWPVGLFQLDRCFMLSRLPLPSGKDLVLINTHNEAFDDGSQRKTQLAVLKQLMLDEYAKGNYVITGGDWNQNPVGFRDLGIGGLGDLGIGRFSNFDVARVIEPPIEADFMPAGWQWVFDPSLPTNRDVLGPYEKGTTKTTIIDFFVVSPNVSVLDIKTDDLGFAWTDHQPVRMDFTTLRVSDIEHP